MASSSGWGGAAAAAPLVPGIVSVGILYGTTATAAGMPSWSVLVSSFLIATGTAQFLAVEMLARGTGWWLVLLLGLLVNLRFAVYSFHLAPFAKELPLSFRLVFLGLINDEGYALTASRWDGDKPGSRGDLWWSAAVMFVVWAAWQLGTALGLLVGAGLAADSGRSTALGLETAIPVTLLAVLMLLVRHRRHLLVAMVAGGVAVALGDFPQGLRLLVGGVAGVLSGMALASRPESATVDGTG